MRRDCTAQDFTAHDVQLDPDFRFVTQYEVRPKKFDFAPCRKTTVIFLGRLLRDLCIQPTEHVGFEWRRWQPPHRIQSETIDPLLARVEKHFMIGG